MSKRQSCHAIKELLRKKIKSLEEYTLHPVEQDLEMTYGTLGCYYKFLKRERFKYYFYGILPSFLIPRTEQLLSNILTQPEQYFDKIFDKAVDKVTA